MRKNNKNEWFVFEEIFKINPQTATSYADYLEQDHLRKYLRGIGLKKYPRQKVLFIYQKGNMKFCYPVDNIENLAKVIFQKLIKSPEWGIRINQDVRRRSEALFKLGQRILKKKTKQLSNPQLVELYQKYYNTHRNMHVSGWFGNLADYEGILSKYLLAYLKEKIKKAKINSESPKIFYTLTLSKELSNAQKEELDLLKLLVRVKKQPEIIKLFQAQNPRSIFIKLAKISPRINKLLSRHAQKYGWLSYQFEGPGWDERYFIKKLKEMLTTSINPHLLIKDIKERPKYLSQEQNKLIEKLRINKKHQLILKVFEEIAFLKGYRKDSMFFGCWARDHLLKEYSRRLKYPIKFIRYIYPHEMRRALINQAILLKLLKERFKFHLYFYEESVGSKILLSQEAGNFIEKLQWQETKVKEQSEIKGMCASPGKAKGVVAIVNVVSDIRKIKKGDILVSEATSPDLMPAIRKAAAIVTNVGGITCHAAIVSRELGIPCIIGTKIATKVLKDGDLVEVDANKAIVKILK